MAPRALVYQRVPHSAMVFLAAALLQAPAGAPVQVLIDTGTRRDALPVVAPHPDPAPYLAVLARGYTARLARLYALEQRFVFPDRTPQPAILVLTNQQGGFPRWGLYRDGAEPLTAYVDLHRNKQPSGHAGAIDQIFPHELLHIIVRDLAGRPVEGRSRQMHALGVTTDRSTAFNEGFAEHAQVMAIEDPDAAPATRAIGDEEVRAETLRQFAGYEAALSARLRIAPGAQMLFPLWYNQAEQVLRFHAVRDNRYAHEADVPRRLYESGRTYDAYLLENTLPGSPVAQRRPVGRLLATEGAVAALFYRLVTDGAIQRAYRDDAFYGQYGTTSREVDPLDNAYLKLFAAIHDGGYDTARVLAAYERLFPDERDALHRVVRSVFLDQAPVAPPELWVLNREFAIGSSIFDQFRGAPRAHGFDLNAASRGDLTSVPGVDLELADRILQAVPFSTIEGLRDVPGMSPAVFDSFRRMRDAMTAPAATREADEQAFSFRAVLMPYARRALIVWLVCAAGGAILYRLVRRVAAWRLAFIGLFASLVALLAGWMVAATPAAAALGFPLLLFGLPATLIYVKRRHDWNGSWRVPLAWAAAALPAAIATTPIG